MTKRELIEEITHLNRTAKPSFLADFQDADLAEYLQHLRWVDQPQSKWQAVGNDSNRAATPADPQPEETDAETDSDSEQVVAETEEPVEVVAVAAAPADSTPAPFAQDSSEEDSQAWLF